MSEHGHSAPAGVPALDRDGLLGLFEDGNIALFQWGNAPGWPVRFASRAAARLLDMPTEPMFGMSFSDFVHPADLDRVAAEVRTAVEEDRETFDHEPYRLILTSGRTIWVNDHTRLIRDRNGKAIAFIGYLHDVTEQETAREARALHLGRLEKAHDDLRRLKEAVDKHALVTIGDHRGRIIYANDAFCAVSGYQRADLLGRPHSVVKSGLHDSAIYSDLWQTIRAGRIWQGELVNKARNGDLFWVMTTILPVLGTNGRPETFIALRTDVTPLRQQQERLTEALERAEAGSRAKSSFLAHMSHELRTPLNAVVGFSEALSYEIYGPLSTTQKRVVEDVRASGSHLLDLINDVLDLSKIEADSLDLKLAPVRPAVVIREVVHLLESQAQRKGVAIADDVPEELPEVVADHLRMRQILLNILSNAIRFSPPGTAVHLHGTVESRRIRLTVTDTGPGMTPEDIEIALKPFGQAARHAHHSTEGTGLGVPISKRLVELHGGCFTIQSAPGAGTRVIIELPRPA